MGLTSIIWHNKLTDSDRVVALLLGDFAHCANEVSMQHAPLGSSFAYLLQVPLLGIGPFLMHIHTD